MRKRFAIRLGSAIAGAVMLVACNGRDDRAQQPLRIQNEDQAQAMVTLSGCVEAAPGADRYILRKVRFEPRTGGDPQRDTTTPGAQGITEGAWVRLTAKGQDLGSRMGQRVTISGVITDNGRNTIGTAGTAGAVTSSGDTSHAASTKDDADKYKAEAGRIARESMANGTAAEIRVQQVQATGEKCNR